MWLTAAREICVLGAPIPGVLMYFLVFYAVYGFVFVFLMLGFCRITVRCGAATLAVACSLTCNPAEHVPTAVR